MILPLKTDRIRTIKVGWVVYGCGGAIQKNVVLEIERLLTAGYTIPEAVQCADVGDRCTGLVCYPADPVQGGPQAFPENLAAPVWFMIDGRTLFDRRY